MAVLGGRRIVLGVCGGIAAYKSVELCRRLVDAGAHVSVVMTDEATRFVGEVTFSALASEPVARSLWDGPDAIPHTRLGQGADLVVVAPATARLLSAYATGDAHDLLTNVLIATRAPVIVCPAMHTEMWEHPAVQDNLAILASRGVQIVEPGSGRLAGGDVGAGRLAEPAEIAEVITGLLGSPRAVDPSEGSDLAGLSVLVSAGGTREPIDAVRFIGNRSSGKQGHAIAEAAARRGAAVTLVTTTALDVAPGVERVPVETAAELHHAVSRRASDADVVVMAAAVADFTPADPVAHKVKKRDGVPVVELRRTVDVLAELGAAAIPRRTVVGFAAETTDVDENARRKLSEKGVDLLVVNDVSAPGVGFEHETNEVTILSKDGAERHVPLTGKAAVADAVLDAVVEHRRTRHDPVPQGAERDRPPGEQT